MVLHFSIHIQGSGQVKLIANSYFGFLLKIKVPRIPNILCNKSQACVYFQFLCYWSSFFLYTSEVPLDFNSSSGMNARHQVGWLQISLSSIYSYYIPSVSVGFTALTEYSLTTPFCLQLTKAAFPFVVCVCAKRFCRILYVYYFACNHDVCAHVNLSLSL